MHQWFQTVYRLSIALLIMAVVGSLQAEKPLQNRELEILPDEKETSYSLTNMRVSKETAAPLALYRVYYAVNPDNPEKMARQYLRENAQQLRIDASLANLRHHATRETPGGLHVHFRQYIDNYRVYKGDINVTIDKNNQVVFVMNGHKPRAVLQNKAMGISLEAAEEIARDYLKVSGRISYEDRETIIYYNKNTTRLAHMITLVPAEEKFGQWEVMVDAQSGEIFRVEDKACYRGPRGHSSVATGSGWVFDPDPLTHARAVYQSGGQFGDNGDNNTDSLLAHIVQRPLLDIEFSGGQYRLNGPYARIIDFEGPFNGTFSQADSNWHYTRSDQAFEAANVYYHIDQSMRYINETLNIALMPYQYSGGVQGDPHGLGGADNSHYIPGSGRLAWGEGGVDDAEDADVILHELGHGLHDWLTSGGLSQVEGLSEGSGDYWCNSYNRSTGFWTPADAQYFWTFQWDGHNEFWPGRITNYNVQYPQGLIGQIHTDGQIWATTLMQIYDDIGRFATDSNFLVGLAMTNSGTNQEDAAQAFIQADVNLFNGANLSAIEQRFTARGYIVTIPIAFPLAPTAFSAYSDYTNDSEMTLIWTDPTEDNFGDPLPAGDFRIYIERDGSLIDSVAGGTGSYTDSGLNDGQSYQYSIYAQIIASGTASAPIDASWIAGGSPVPATPAVFNIGGDANQITVSWTNASVNDDGTPMDDLAGINLYQNGVMVSSFAQTSSDTGAAASESYTPATPGNYDWQISTIDNENPQNESVLSASQGTPLALPISDDFNIAGDPNPGIWLNSGTEVNGRADNPPSGGLSLNLNGSPSGEDIIDLKPIDLNGMGGAGIQFRYSYQPQGTGNAPEEGDSLRIHFKNDLGQWILIRAYPGTTVQPFVTETIELDNESAGGGSFFHGQFQVRLRSTGGAGQFPNDDWFVDDVTLGLPTGIDDLDPAPKTYALEQNFPNPFNPTTDIRYQISDIRFTTLTVYDVLGREIKTLVSETQQPGTYKVQWDGRDDAGMQVGSGIYFYTLNAGEFSATRRMLLVR